MAESAIASGATGTVRISGAVTTASSVSTGSPYYLSATAGAVTVTPPTNAVRIGIAVSSTSIVLGMTDTPVGPRGPPCGRLTLTSNTPVTTSDVTAATTVYYTPYGGCNQVSTFDGTAWTVSAFSQLSIAVPATTATVYDVFIYDNAGALALELTAWTNDTTRATALTTQNGVYVKTGALTRLYLGSFRTTGVSGQTADAAATRLLWNYFNRVERPLSVLPTTDSWTYTTATWRQANNSTANQVAVMVGVAEDAIALDLMAHVQSDTLGRIVNSAIGEDSTTTPLGVGGGGTISYMNQFVATYMLRGLAQVRKIPAAGYHFYAWLEYSGAGGTTTWYGDVGLPTQMQSGLVGTWKC
jgi:hypothetical protein